MRLEKKATIVSMCTASILVLIKMSVGVISGSIAVLASAIDSLLDLTVSLFNYFALHNAEKDPDNRFHFGRGKIEPLAAVIEGAVVSLSALFILYEALIKITHERPMESLSESIWVMIASFIMTALLVSFLNFVAKKTKSLVIKADALHYKTDLFSNGAILLALGLISVTGIQLIDPILGIVIAIYMIYSAIPIIKEGTLMLLDAALPQEDTDKIIKIIKSEKEVSNYHFLQTREDGTNIFISVHVVFNTDISLFNAHAISDKIELEIKKLFSDKKVHVLIHTDPYDDSDENEVKKYEDY